jgi:hypothetical protein
VGATAIWLMAASYSENVKELRDREIGVARHAERAYKRFVSQWQARRPNVRRTGAGTR